MLGELNIWQGTQNAASLLTEYSSQSYDLNHSRLEDLAFPEKYVTGHLIITGSTGEHSGVRAMSLTVPKAGVTPLLDIDDADGVAEVTVAFLS